MTQLIARADFAERLVPRAEQPFDQSNTASVLTPGGAVDAAPPVPPPSAGGAAFLHFTESSGRPVATVPDRPAPAGASAGAGRPIQLSGAARFILRLIAAHDGRSEADVLAGLIAAEARAIGLSPLLSAGGQDLGEDLADLPDFGRRARNRFRPLEADRHNKGFG